MCGIVGVVSHSPVNQIIYDALLLLQHRGQDAAGIATSQADWSVDFDVGMNFMEWHAPVPLAHEKGVPHPFLRCIRSASCWGRCPDLAQRRLNGKALSSHEDTGLDQLNTTTDIRTLPPGQVLL